jgi:UDP-N-acetylglucosamine--N-acetylmuramyl-(pentapeptide) pyrophosphoryl-undecaprenol N-acetylglucosamine transferase
LLKAAYQVSRVFRQVKPDLCLGVGGFSVGPGGIMAWLTRTPLIIHEQNAIAGLTNRCLARLATKILCGFPGAFPSTWDNVAVVGNPVRAEILAVADKKPPSRIPPLKVLVLGGSQGAKALNHCVPQALSQLSPELRPQIWHQTGALGFDETEALYAQAGLVNAKVMPFIEDMPLAYAWADLLVCRAGALTIAEISSVGIPSILVPYPWAVDDHQTANAQFLVKAGAAQCIQQSVLTPDWLAQQWVHFQSQPQELEKMRAAAKRIPLNDATSQIVQYCQKVLAC